MAWSYHNWDQSITKHLFLQQQQQRRRHHPHDHKIAGTHKIITDCVCVCVAVLCGVVADLGSRRMWFVEWSGMVKLLLLQRWYQFLSILSGAKHDNVMHMIFSKYGYGLVLFGLALSFPSKQISIIVIIYYSFWPIVRTSLLTFKSNEEIII